MNACIAHKSGVSDALGDNFAQEFSLEKRKRVRRIRASNNRHILSYVIGTPENGESPYLRKTCDSHAPVNVRGCDLCASYLET